MEEHIGVNIEEIKLATRVLPRCKHCIGTTHGTSDYYCGGPIEVVGGVRERNIFSGCVRRDVSYLIFK